MFVLVTAGQEGSEKDTSFWWIFGLVAGLLLLVLTGLFAFLKLRGNHQHAERKARSLQRTRLIQTSEAYRHNTCVLLCLKVV